MDITQAIRSYAPQPLTHQLLLSLLKEYKRPNAKLHALLREGILKPIRRGLYIAGPMAGTNKPEPFLLANHILGPSYVSTDSALSYYDLIPERVFEISSMTTKASREFNTTMGLYSYTRLPLPYYSFGIRQIRLTDQQYALIACPEKALCDKVIITSGLLLRSPKDAKIYLLEDLRMDEEKIKEFDTESILTWLPGAAKKESLSMIIKMIQNL